jgi:hypothetical protein
MERKIVRSPRQFDFMNVDRVAAVSHQEFLSARFLLRRIDPHPDQQAVPFRELVQSPPAFAVESSTYYEHRNAVDDKPEQNGQNGDDERPRIVHHEKARRGDPSGATGDAADDGLRAGDIVVAKGRRGAIGISARSAGGIDA